MSRRQLKTDDEEGFIRAFRDEVMDLVSDYKVRIEFHLAIPVTRGGVEIRGIAYRNNANDDEQWYAQANQPYPSHSCLRLHAALYRAAVKLGGAIRERRIIDETKDSPPVD